MDLVQEEKTNRNPIAAGRFYPASPEELKTDLNNLLRSAKNLTFPIEEYQKLLALIVPHAGYVYSGLVAASAYSFLENTSPPKKIFLLGSSHHTTFNGASVYSAGDYITPLGQVTVDLDTANELIHKSAYIDFVPGAHSHEHSLEVQLPFLQKLWGNDFRIIPIILATDSPEICKNVAMDLTPYLNDENLFIISTDLSHYPNYEDAIRVDAITKDSILSGNPDFFLKQIENNKKMGIPDLATSICGWTSVLTLMHMAENIKHVQYRPISYRNSGDSKPYGDHNSVVGYQSMLLTKKSEDIFYVSREEQKILLETAELSICLFLQKQKHLNLKNSYISSILNKPLGAFVSVYVDGELRGCIGRIKEEKISIIKLIAQLAVTAAIHDNRFDPVTKDEFDKLKIEISVLSPLHKIKDKEEIIPGKHGIYIKKDFRSGTFLPQVIDNTNWTVEEFLGNCSKNKAGLGWDGWKNAEVYTYEAQIFSN